MIVDVFDVNYVFKQNFVFILPNKKNVISDATLKMFLDYNELKYHDKLGF
jgi:hypothetical protein